MKKLLFLISIIWVTPVIAQGDLLFSNGDIAYDSSYNCIYYSNKQIAFFYRTNTFCYVSGAKAYENRYKNVSYDDGNIAYNNLYRNTYYSNGNPMYLSSKGLIYDKEGKIIKKISEIPESGYEIEDKNIKFTIFPSKVNFEVRFDDEEYYLVSDIRTYIKIISKSDNKLQRTIKLSNR